MSDAAAGRFMLMAERAFKERDDLLKVLRAIASTDKYEMDGVDQTAEIMRKLARAAIAKAAPPRSLQPLGDGPVTARGRG